MHLRALHLPGTTSRRCSKPWPLLLLLPSLALAQSYTPTPQPEPCRVHAAQGLPGSDRFASHFLEAMSADPRDPDIVWGLTTDLSDELPPAGRAMYISKSSDGGRTWAPIARIGSRYFDASIAEGLRNGLAVLPDGSGFILTTQLGAFQVQPRPAIDAPAVTHIPGPVVPDPRPILSAPKQPGDPVRANVVIPTADAKRLIIGYGYFDLNPQLYSYRRTSGGNWIEDREIKGLPTDLDLFSMQSDDPRRARPGYLYVGTGDQAFRLNLRTKRWIRIDGVGEDSSIHSMSTVGGPHFAACWGVYEPINASTVYRVTQARFLLHRLTDEVGSKIRAYGIEVDPRRPSHQVLSAITGAYVTRDTGKTWRRLNNLPDGEFHTAHFNLDGSIIVSGFMGSFTLDPFAKGCTPQLQIRRK